MLTRLYWPSWVLAVATTGLVAGFMVSHALLLGRLLDWLLASHYGSGFGAVEQAVLRSVGEIPGGLAARFVAWNAPCTPPS